jgi:hypothetical protein
MYLFVEAEPFDGILIESEMHVLVMHDSEDWFS